MYKLSIHILTFRFCKNFKFLGNFISTPSLLLPCVVCVGREAVWCVCGQCVSGVCVVCAQCSVMLYAWVCVQCVVFVQLCVCNVGYMCINIHVQCMCVSYVCVLWCMCSVYVCDMCVV